MDIKSKKVVARNAGNVGWIEEVFTFTTGQKATFHTHTHATKCFNGIGKEITETEIGQKMIQAVANYIDPERNSVAFIGKH